MTTQNPAVKSVPIENLEAAFAGELMAHIKCRYFAKLAREAGADDVAKIFENTADQEGCTHSVILIFSIRKCN